MEAGKLKYKISIFRETATTDDEGQTTYTYSLNSTARAQMVFGRGWKSVVQDELVYQRSYYFTVRHYVDVKDSDIIRYRGGLYRVISIAERTEENCIELTCEEVIDAESYELEED